MTMKRKDHIKPSQQVEIIGSALQDNGNHMDLGTRMSGFKS